MPYVSGRKRKRVEVSEVEKFLRFKDLVARGIVKNWTTLLRWIREEGFHEPVKLGPNTTAWPESEIEKWKASRPRVQKASRPRAHKVEGK